MTRSATRSGNPAKKAAAKKTTTRKTTPSTGPSSVTDFKKRREGRTLPLPSGLTVIARRVEIGDYIKRNGEVFNPLLGLVGEALEKGQMIDVDKAIKAEGSDDFDLSKLNDMYELINALVVETVVNPKIHPTPEVESDRDDDLLYVDEVDDEDKMFLFQWAIGGTDDIASFREEAVATLDAMAKVPSRP